MSGGIKSMSDAKDMLKALLLLINAAESGENEQLASDGQVMLSELRKQIACVWYSNTDLEPLDKVFAVCGWDGQGFRWCRDEEESSNGRLVMALYVVEFEDDCNNQAWKPI